MVLHHCTGAIQFNMSVNRKQKKTKKRARMRATTRFENFSFAPPYSVRPLMFQKSFLMNNSSSAVANNYFIPTYVYDVDPVVGSTSVPGFTEWGSLYRFYRTEASSVTISISNLEITAVTVYLGVTNFAPNATTNFSSPSAQAMRSQPTTKSVMVPPGNTALFRLSSSDTTKRIAGVRNPSMDYYVAPTSGSAAPANNWYWLVGGTPVAGTFSNGVAIDITIRVRVMFFELATPST